MRHQLGPMVALAVLSVCPIATAQDAASFFEENCSGCHTIGQGPQAGPDLKGVTARRDREWLIRFLVDTDAFAADPDVVRMIQEADGLVMPATPGMTRELASQLIGLIERRSGAAAPGSTAEEAPVTEADVSRGRALFTGEAKLSGSGPSCIGCHAAAVAGPHGGRLGPDLTSVHDRLGGRAGLAAWLGTTPTPLMRAMYRPAPLTADESRALVAFLASADTASGPSQASLWPLTVLALGGCACVLIGAGTVWSARFRALRRPLVARWSQGTIDQMRHALGPVGYRPVFDPQPEAPNTVPQPFKAATNRAGASDASGGRR